MRTSLVALCVAAMLMAACTDEPPEKSTMPSPLADVQTPRKELAETEIYSAVIRQLVTRDHTFGGGPSPFNSVYVVNGAINDAGEPLGDHFGPAAELFPPVVVDGIEERLRDLPPVRFIIDGSRARSGKEGLRVKNEGVIISLGPIKRDKGGVRVPTGLWCGGTCGQWLTYVLEKRDQSWRITGTTGPYAIS
jgi:hypothetical protein